MNTRAWPPTSASRLKLNSPGPTSIARVQTIRAFSRRRDGPRARRTRESDRAGMQHLSAYDRCHYDAPAAHEGVLAHLRPHAPRQNQPENHETKTQQRRDNSPVHKTDGPIAAMPTPVEQLAHCAAESPQPAQCESAKIEDSITLPRPGRSAAPCALPTTRGLTQLNTVCRR